MQGPVLEPFVYDEAHPYAGGQHRGIDIGADAAGDAVVAPAAGTVGFAGTVPTSGESVTIETSDGYSVTLTHLGSILVSKGAAIAEGDDVGTVGPSGTPEVDGPYVHLGIRVTADPNGYLDPLGFLPPPIVQSPPADTGSGSSTPQPSTSSGTSAAAPATQPATSAVSMTTPATRGRARPKHSHARSKRRGRATSSAPETEPAGSWERAPVDARSSAAGTTSRGAKRPQHRLSEPTKSSERPVVEAAGNRAPTGLGTGHESSPGAPGTRPVPASQPQTPPALLPLVCNGAAALVAVAAAIVTGARRRRRAAGTSPSAGGQVLRLPVPAREPRRERRAA
ncbi:MAG: peptidoglycan DD-metalloendopeptidase family protein [Gaiellaceae bacterium]